MKLRTALVALGTVAIATLGLVAPASASAAPHRSTGPVQFDIWSTNPADNAIATVIANGKIHAQGADETVSSNQSGTRGVDKFTFPRGSLNVFHATTRGTSRDRMDPRTCLGSHSEDGVFAVNGGTGRYQGASGSGRYHLLVTFIGCSQNHPPSVFVEHVSAQGSLRD